MEISFSHHSIAELPDTVLPRPPPRRNGSLIRPERLRIDPQHPQYHTRKRLTNEDYYRPAGDRSGPTRRSVLRRGLLRREEEDDEKQEQSTDQLIVIEDPANTASRFDIWKTFCYFVTCCCPPPILKAMGKNNAQGYYLDNILINYTYIYRQKR
jgi:chitin synthase